MREAVQHAAILRQLRHGEAVVLLVEEEAGLLPVFHVYTVIYAVFTDLGNGAVRMGQPREPAFALRKSLALTERRVVALE